MSRTFVDKLFLRPDKRGIRVSLLGNMSKKYIKSPIDGKITKVTPSKITVENIEIHIHRPSVRVGDVVTKGQVIGY